jgi:DNA-binding response OmpR family regulator
MSRILLVEDDLAVREMVQDDLSAAQFIIDSAADGKDGLYLLLNRHYDLVILDWELPQMTGLEILRAIRAKGLQLPVLVLTGRSNIADKECGFDSGADDYLTKPFSLRELKARVRALLRRPAASISNGITLGNLTVDIDRHCANVNGVAIDLHPREYLVLEFLARNPQMVFGASEIIDKIWPLESDVSELAVRTVISRLRAKLESSGTTVLLETLRGLGYRLSPP